MVGMGAATSLGPSISENTIRCPSLLGMPGFSSESESGVKTTFLISKMSSHRCAQVFVRHVLESVIQNHLQLVIVYCLSLFQVIYP